MVAPAREEATRAERSRERRAWELLEAVLDPEIPVLSIVDLGIVRSVRADRDGTLEVAITPTYSGCPATEVIRAAVDSSLKAGEVGKFRVIEELAPAWSSDWISAAGHEKLRAYGIAPPERAVTEPRRLFCRVVPACPRCGSEDSELTSEFGSTPCKSLHKCRSCLEPFDHFKCI